MLSAILITLAGCTGPNSALEASPQEDIEIEIDQQEWILEVVSTAPVIHGSTVNRVAQIQDTVHVNGAVVPTAEAAALVKLVAEIDWDTIEAAEGPPAVGATTYSVRIWRAGEPLHIASAPSSVIGPINDALRERTTLNPSLDSVDCAQPEPDRARCLPDMSEQCAASWSANIYYEHICASAS